MFGYVRPALDRLTQDQRDDYQSAYCGLCHALSRRHGWLARLTLQYDFTFLAGRGSVPQGGARSTPSGPRGPAWRAGRWTPPPTRA